MLPVMCMLRCMAPRGNIKNSHAEIICTISLADHHTGGDPLCRSIIKTSWFDVGIFFMCIAFSP